MAAQDRIDLFLRSQENSSNNLPHVEVSRLYFYESSSDPWGIKDTRSRYIYVNAAYLELLNLPANFDITGKTFEDVSSNNAEFAKMLRKHEELVISKKRPYYSSEIGHFGKDQRLKPYIFERMPYFSGIDLVTGTEFHGIAWVKFALIHSSNEYLGRELNSRTINIPTEFLTEREWEIMYLYCTGLTGPQVADYFKISLDRVKTVIQVTRKKIRDKLQIDTKNDLINTIIKLGWINYPPEYLLLENQGYRIYDISRFHI